MTEYHKKEPSMSRMHFEYLSWLLTVRIPEITGNHITQEEIILIGHELRDTNFQFKLTRWLDEFHKNRRRATHLHPIRYDNHAGI